MTRFAGRLTVVALLLTGCQSLPEPGSVAALNLAAQNDAFYSCVKRTMKTYPRVATSDVWFACDRSVRRTPQLVQRVAH